MLCPELEQELSSEVRVIRPAHYSGNPETVRGDERVAFYCGTDLVAHWLPLYLAVALSLCHRYDEHTDLIVDVAVMEGTDEGHFPVAIRQVQRVMPQ